MFDHVTIRVADPLPPSGSTTPFCARLGRGGVPPGGTTAGYRDNGAPGERPEYHDGYYGAFVLDPDGHVEVVNHHR